jgi:hypothetical protein
MRAVPGAGHTFEEPGALGQVGELAVDGWVLRDRRAKLVMGAGAAPLAPA